MTQKEIQRVLLFSRAEAPKLEEILTKNKFKVVNDNPDFIVCYGGDGTILFAERKHPGIPKLIVKRTSICRKCDYTIQDMDEILPRIRNGKYQILEKMKLKATFDNHHLVGLNEIQIHMKLPISAIRFSLSVNGKSFENLIGDGMIMSTPFGSTGYYKATGGKPFNKGIGISLNNLHNKNIESFVVPEDSNIKLKITRGPVLLLADNNEKILELERGDAFSVKKADSSAHLLYIN